MTNSDDDTFTEMLSPAGRRRRHAILHTALKAARQRRVRRHAARAAAGGGMATAIAIVTLLSLPRGETGPGKANIVEAPSPKPTYVARPIATSPSPLLADRVYVVRPRHVEVTIVSIATDRTLANQWAAPRSLAGAEVQRIDDAVLMKALGSAGLSGGVVVREGRPELWWQPTVLRSGGTHNGKGKGI